MKSFPPRIPVAQDAFSFANIHCPTCGLKLVPGTTNCPNDGTVIEGVIDVGQIVADKYQILRRTASGGMGEVYQANQLGLNRMVALKILSRQVNSVAVRRFQQEAQALAAMRHENLTEVYDVGVTTSGQPYMAMEWIEGATLSSLFEAKSSMSLLKAINIVMQICQGLAYVHSQGILHRDLKPSNIILIHPSAECPLVKLLDFGIAKDLNRSVQDRLTQTGEVVGSPAYMSPEQARGGQTDQRSDIYALGCIMFEILTGKPAFSGASFADILIKQTTENAPLLNKVVKGKSYPNDLEQIVEKALRKQPAERYQNVGELAQALQSVARRIGIDSQPANQQTAVWIPWLTGCILIAGAVFAVSQTLHLPLSSNYAQLQYAEGEEINVDGQSESSLADTLKRLQTRSSHYLRRFSAASTPFDDSEVETLKSFPLESLDLSNTKVTSSCFTTLSNINTVERLALNQDNLSNGDFKLLTDLTDLNTFSGADCQLDDRQVVDLLATHEISRLDLSNNSNLTDSSIKAMLADGEPLVSLSLSDDNMISNEALASLSQIQTLKELDISKTQIDDRGLIQLGKLPRLVKLKLDYAGVSDYALNNLNCQSLRYLSLQHCSDLSSSSIAKFAARYPNCDIHSTKEANHSVEPGTGFGSF